MEESILKTVKDIIGINKEDTAFDSEIISDINSELFILNDLGLGNGAPFFITGESEKWSDLLDDDHKLELIKPFVGLRVRLVFDPPASSSVAESLKAKTNELEWRINSAVDMGKEKEQSVEGGA